MQSTTQTDQSNNANAPRAVERRQHSKEFKAEAVRLVKEGGRSFRDVAQSLDLDIGLLRKWAKALGTQGVDAFRGHGQRTAIEQEAHDLRQQNKRLREENDILKKAARYLDDLASRPTPREVPFHQSAEGHPPGHASVPNTRGQSAGLLRLAQARAQSAQPQ